MIYQKWYTNMPGSELREISVLFAPTVISLKIQAPPVFPISIKNSAYPSTTPQAQVSPDPQAAITVQRSRDKKQGSIDSYFSDFRNATHNYHNATSQTILIVNACDSPATQTHLMVFDKAFNTHSPPSTKASYSAGCPTIKPKATRLDTSFDAANKTVILVHCSKLSNSACPVVTRTSVTITQWTAIVALANQNNTGQGHTPPHLESAVQTSPKRTNYNNDSEITLGNSELSSNAPNPNAATEFNALSTWRTPSIQSPALVPLNITCP